MSLEELHGVLAGLTGAASSSAACRLLMRTGQSRFMQPVEIELCFKLIL